ncbi:hypothetical protein [Dethiothermospora halolimnae]|uniref:hypothetical protein n=1 Tax=Dethiothermospora halolimnae TaxID=3114390 RepID=UPI003CCB963C
MENILHKIKGLKEKDFTLELCKELLLTDIKYFQYIPDKFKDLDMSMRVLGKDKSLIKYVPDNIKEKHEETLNKMSISNHVAIIRSKEENLDKIADNLRDLKKHYFHKSVDIIEFKEDLLDYYKQGEKVVLVKSNSDELMDFVWLADEDYFNKEDNIITLDGIEVEFIAYEDIQEYLILEPEKYYKIID